MATRMHGCGGQAAKETARGNAKANEGGKEGGREGGKEGGKEVPEGEVQTQVFKGVF